MPSVHSVAPCLWFGSSGGGAQELFQCRAVRCAERRASNALRDIAQPVDGPWGSQLLKRTLSTVATSTLLQVAITAGSVMWAPVG